jgi:ABC-type phosphate transport system substrate-binding protein
MSSAIRHFWILPLMLMFLLGSLVCEAKQLAVIVDKTNTTVELSLVDLVKIFKGESSRWPDGKAVTVILRDLSTPEMQTAMQKIYKMQPEEVKSLIAARKGTIIIAHSEEELLKLVAGTPGAIGLVDVYSINNRVSVLKIEGKLPLQPGYVLKSN